MRRSPQARRKDWKLVLGWWAIVVGLALIAFAVPVGEEWTIVLSLASASMALDGLILMPGAP